MRKKALIFYISRFSGHYNAARSIEEALIDRYGDVDIKIVNAFEYTNPILGKIITKAYLEVIKNRPDFWGSIYDNPEVLDKIKKARDVFHKYNMPKMNRLMESFAPDIVYCTQAYPCGMIADYKKINKVEVPLVGVLTDHAPHSYWLFEEVDVYVVPSEGVADALINKGVPDKKVRIFGIPINKRFREKIDRDKAREEFGISEGTPVILIMGGNQGLGSLDEVVGSFAVDENRMYNIFVVTGKNRGLYRRLRRKYSRTHGKARIEVFSYIENIEKLMEVSDLIITKAGGITTSEALTKKLPLIIVDPIPGQERMNTDYLVTNGAAIEVSEIKDIFDRVNRLFDSKEMLRDMRLSAEKLSRPYSARDIAGLMEGVR